MENHQAGVRAEDSPRFLWRGLLTADGSPATLLEMKPDIASICVPDSLLLATVKAAILFSIGPEATAGAISCTTAALTREVLKMMLLSRIKITTATLLALILTGAGFWQARTWADGKAQQIGNSHLPAKEVVSEGGFHVTVKETIHTATTIATQIDLEALPGLTLEIVTDAKQGKSVLSADLSPRPNGPSTVQLTLRADRVKAKEGRTDEVRFTISYKIDKSSGSTSETVAMPGDAKTLADVLTVALESGEHKFGRATKLATFNGSTYTLVVNKPK